MGKTKLTDIIWPPAGWPQFASVKLPSGQSVAKNVGGSRIFGLQYTIDSVPLFQGDTRYFRHNIRIDGWEYSILNESIEYPVLSFSIMDRFDPSLPLECFVSEIRSYDSHIPHTRRSASRAVSAALFMIRQISEGNVPDVNRVLRIYKLHPNQSILYRNDRSLGSDLKRAFEDGQVKAYVGSVKA
ncbi:MAG: hypothetical protein DI626_10240 [Micavibrio aeruginosavorus]|uniref:Uncharacterized protein n=1 Tax=Micavibrio aeruginosavorus TaxID=349221 RepID=A0A2W4ZKZ9_9BACT|nr:MAG: hypothetical protein DI626_10240 [Micavibrio aeruginosavorus]